MYDMRARGRRRARITEAPQKPSGAFFSPWTHIHRLVRQLGTSITAVPLWVNVMLRRTLRSLGRIMVCRSSVVPPHALAYRQGRVRFADPVRFTLVSLHIPRSRCTCESP